MSCEGLPVFRVPDGRADDGVTAGAFRMSVVAVAMIELSVVVVAMEIPVVVVAMKIPVVVVAMETPVVVVARKIPADVRVPVAITGNADTERIGILPRVPSIRLVVCGIRGSGGGWIAAPEGVGVDREHFDLIFGTELALLSLSFLSFLSFLSSSSSPLISQLFSSSTLFPKLRRTPSMYLCRRKVLATDVDPGITSSLSLHKNRKRIVGIQYRDRR